MKLFLPIAVILFFSLTFGCSFKNEMDQYKEKISTTYTIENGKEVKGDEWRMVREFDESGNVIKSQTYLNGELEVYSDDCAKPSDGSVTITNFNGDGTINTINEKVFKNGNELSSNVLNGDGEFVFRLDYIYDSKNRIKQRITSPGQSGVPNRVVYEYDDENHTSTILSYNVDGTLSSKITNNLDAHGNILNSEKIQYWKGKAYRITKCDYVDGNCTSETSSAPDGKVFSQIETDYNRAGTREVRRTFKPNKETGELELVEIERSKIKY